MDSGVARKIAGGLGHQAAFALALACLFLPVMPAPRAEDLGAPPVAPQDFEDTVRSTIRWLKENRIDVVFVGVHYTVRLARDANYVA